MANIGHYEIIEKLSEGKNRTIYRAMDINDERYYVLKVLNSEYSDPLEIYKLKHEYEILNEIQSDTVVQAFKVETIEHFNALVVEDFGAVSLKHFLRKHSLDTLLFLKIAKNIVDAVCSVHEKEIIHKDINPTNILINEQTYEIKLSDFGISEKISKHATGLKTNEIIIGTYEYLSPEQSGRVNKSVDFRSDIYSLGITYYEMVTGRLPFQSKDVVELIHSHIAISPESPHDINLEIPIQISNIIMKMIEKNPDNRYQSLTGVREDLLKCIELYNSKGIIEPFEMGKREKKRRFIIPDILLGRTDLVDQLKNSLNSVSMGGNEAVFVHGEFGSGKTYLLRHFENTYMNDDVHILYGYCEDDHLNEPYYVLKQIFRTYIKRILSESDERIEQFKNKMDEYLGPNIKILSDMIPELKRFYHGPYGNQSLNPFETANRIKNLMHGFIRLMTTEEYPTVFLLDDLHKADSGTFEVLDYILSDKSMKRVLIIGAFEETVPMTEQLSSFLSMKKDIIDFKIIRLPVLKLSDMNELVKSMFGLTHLETGVLSNILLEKTNGNPYFVFEMLKDAYEKNDLHFDLRIGHWSFDRDKMQSYEVYNNVVENVLKRVAEVSEETQEILSLAACIGVEFDFRILLEIASFELSVIKASIKEALDRQLLLSNDQRIQYLSFVEDEPITFRFLHEKVRAALFEKLPPEDQVQTVYDIGKYEVKTLEDKTLIAVETVDHLNFSRTLIDDRYERIQLAKFNYKIGLDAKNINSYQIASKYLTAALELVDDQLFEQDYQFYYDLYLIKAETEYLNHNFDTAELYFDHLNQLLSDPLDKARVLKTKMVLYINQGKTHDTFALAKEALKLLGFDISINPGYPQVLKELLAFKMNRKIHSPEDLMKLPTMTDPIRLMIMEILMTLISVTYLVSRNLFIYVIMKMLNYSVKYGHSYVSPYAYAIYGLLEGVAFRNPESGLRYGEVGLKLSDDYGNYEIINKCSFTVGFFLNHWVNHSAENLKYLNKAIQNGFYAGDMVFYTYSVAAYLLTLLEMGENLDYIIEEIDEHFDSIKAMRVNDVFNMIEAVKQYILCLKGKTNTRTNFQSEDFDQVAFEERLENSSMMSIYAVYNVLQLKLYYLFGAYESVVELCDHLKPLFNELIGLMPYAHLKFYQSLALLKLVERGSDHKKRYLYQVNKNQRLLKRWTKHASANFSHKFHLVEAEKCRISGAYSKAEKHYLEAVKNAQKYGFTQDEALACELFAEYYNQIDNQRVRKVYLKDAYYAYSNWGAVSKKQFMKELYPEVVFDDVLRKSHEEITTTTATSGSESLRFDYLTIIKSSQTLSAEIVLEELLRKLITIILENAGADRVVLMMKQEQLNVEAVGSTSDVIRVLNKKPVKGSGVVPESIVNYVMRTGEIFITDQIELETRLKKDVYFNYHRPCSVLCLPIFNKGTIYGVLYLENNLIDGAFRENGVEVLNILTSQFAFSYENAQLYRNLTLSESELKLHKENLEILVEDRTRELSYANAQIQNLLDNAGQGFLSFDQMGVISKEYSKECYKIFRADIAGESFSELIGNYISSDERNLIDRIIEKIFLAHNDFESNVYLSLLPKEIIVHEQIVSIEYRHIEDLFEKKVMVILTDITETKALETAREEEKRNLKMIVKAVKYQNNFRKSLEDYVQFYNHDIYDLFKPELDARLSMMEFYRLIHTFKGDFAQWSMIHTEHALHDLESLIQMKLGHQDLDYQEAYEFVEEIDFGSIIEKDLNIVKEYVGVSFLQSTEKLEIEKSMIIELENRLNTVTHLNELEEIVYEVRKARFTNFKEVLHQFDEYLKNLALGLNKKINDIMILGDDVLVDKSHYYAFIRAINHIFRNMIDYGIETPNERVNDGKDEMGSIICRIEKKDGDHFKLILRDDGGGIDIPKLKRALKDQKVLSEVEIEQLDRHTLLQYVFADQISTKSEQTHLSGRGIGLAAVRKEIMKLGGCIEVYSQEGVGTSFEIELPILDD